MSDARFVEGEVEASGASTSTAPVALDRVASFLFVSGAILLLFSAFLLTVRLVEGALQRHFEQVVEQAIDVPVGLRSPGEAIRANLQESVERSPWVRFWGVDVGVVVMARGGGRWLYVNGEPQVLRYPNRDPEVVRAIHARLLPATARVTTSVDHNTVLSNSILVVYAAVFLVGFFLHNRKVLEHQSSVLDEARATRDEAASTARRIEQELEAVRAEFQKIEPVEQQHRDEITRLQSEQHELRDRMAALAARERELRGQADRVSVLEEDSRVLEEMLEEATRTLSAKDTEIRELEQDLKRGRAKVGSARGKSRARELIAKRMRTLYPELEFDERAIDDLVDLQDEATRLRAEECIKRLAEDKDSAGVRRKVGGLPNHLSIYEVGFAGKRRLYYAKVKNGRFRVLVIGAKNTQQTDLVYLSKIPKGEIVS